MALIEEFATKNFKVRIYKTPYKPQHLAFSSAGSDVWCEPEVKDATTTTASAEAEPDTTGHQAA